MRPFLKITVRGDRMTIETPNQHEEMANLIGITGEHRIVSIGETEEEIRRTLAPGHEAEFIVRNFYPIFDVRALSGQIDGLTPQIALEIVEAAIKYLVNRTTGIRGVVFGWFGRPDLLLDIPGYETLPEYTRIKFQTTIQYEVEPEQFRINEVEVGIPAWKMRIAKLAIALPTWLWFAAVLGPALLRWIKLVSPSEAFSLTGILLGLAVAGAIIGPLPWVLAIRNLVPASLSRLLLFSSLPGIPLFRKWYTAIADRVVPPTEPLA